MPSCVCQNQPRASSASQYVYQRNRFGSIFFTGLVFLGAKINGTQMGVSKNRCTPKSSILIGFSLIFTIHFGGFYPNFWKHPNMITTDCPPVSNDLRGILFPNFFYSPDPISRVCSTLFHLSQRRLGVDKFAGFPRFGGNEWKPSWLVVSSHLKNISQNGNLPQVGVKIKNI